VPLAFGPLPRRWCPRGCGGADVAGWCRYLPFALGELVFRSSAVVPAAADLALAVFGEGATN
jgi:hypothetical protein